MIPVPATPATSAASRAGVRRDARRGGGVLRHLLIPLAVVAALLTLGWMLLLPGVLAERLERATGFPVTSGRLMANPLTGHLRLTDARLGNPDGFPAAPFLHIARLETTARPWTLRQTPLAIPAATLDIDTLTLVIAADGSRNNRLWDTALAGLGSDGRPPLRIARLELAVARVVVADYSRGTPPRLAEYRLDYRRVHEDVTRFEPLWDDVLAAARR